MNERARLRRETLTVLRHVERWGGRADYSRLFDHLVAGKNHRLYPEDLDASISQLIFAGYARVDDGVVHLVGGEGS